MENSKWNDFGCGFGILVDLVMEKLKWFYVQVSGY